MKDEANRESNLVKIRERLDLTQKEVADALGVTEQTVRNWEHGRAVPKLTIPQMKALCRLLQCSLEEVPDYLGPSSSAPETEKPGLAYPGV
jgi:DNA-binding XRE family transcriptional regulator